MNFLTVKIHKPLYGNFVNIREKYLDEAIRNRVLLRIEIPNGVGIHCPKEWKKNGKRVEQVFNFPDNPMVLWGNTVKIKKKQTEDERMEEFSKVYLV